MSCSSFLFLFCSSLTEELCVFLFFVIVALQIFLHLTADEGISTSKPCTSSLTPRLKVQVDNALIEGGDWSQALFKAGCSSFPQTQAYLTLLAFVLLSELQSSVPLNSLLFLPALLLIPYLNHHRGHGWFTLLLLLLVCFNRQEHSRFQKQPVALFAVPNNGINNRLG